MWTAAVFWYIKKRKVHHLNDILCLCDILRVKMQQLQNETNIQSKHIKALTFSVCIIFRLDCHRKVNDICGDLW